jgi:nicotinamidase-related amidase
MWDKMPCIPVEARANELAKEIEKVITIARKKGILIIHAPSGDLENFDKNYPEKPKARETSKEYRKGFGNSKHWDAWEHSSPSEDGIRFPVDVGDGGCNRPECEGRPHILRQTNLITIADNDVLTDDYVEIKDYTKAKGIKNIILMGVHTNMCIIGRPFGLRAMKKAGYNVTLMRDMTDASYNNDYPKTPVWPNVDHYAGLALILEHIEKYICPTLTSTDFTNKPPFQFAESIKKNKEPKEQK